MDWGAHELALAARLPPCLPPPAAQVLHYLNATVSLQLQLLHDEEEEAQWVDPLITRARKPFTCPVALAHAKKLEAELASLAGIQPGAQAQVGEQPP